VRRRWSPALLVLAPLLMGAGAGDVSSLVDTDVEGPSYQERLDDLQVRRRRLARAYQEAISDSQRSALLAASRRAVLYAIVDEIVPAWYGTSWDYSGTSQIPGRGAIACGYLVSTVLEHAGFRVERVALAQQAAEHIILTMVPPDRVHRFRERSREEVVADVQEQGEGLYIVGLDYHVGFLLVRDDGSGSPAVQMCHSSWLGSSGALCEPAATSPAMISSYTVTGPVLTEPTVVAWLEGRSLPTVGEAHL